MNALSAGVSICITLLTVQIVYPQQNQRRNRGETFYQCQNSNTPGKGNIWVSLRAVGHLWDDAPISLSEQENQSTDQSPRRWISNVRAFPEIMLQAGILDFLSINAESRVLSYGFTPGYFGGGIKATWPNNQELRLHGVGLSLQYRYQMRESAPSLGGYIGFMPEGFVVKGSNIETRVHYELDLLPRLTILPIRLLASTGFRVPFRRRNLSQLLTEAAVVYSGHGFDFFAQYSLESFANLFHPIEVSQPEKRFLVWFSENPMYATLGGNVRYDNGITLSLAVPILLSVNQGSRMRREDLVELHRNESPGLFTEEKERNIVDPFDPWFVKWKVAGTLTFPLRFKMTGTELMRNYLLLKNRRQEKKIDIDNRIQLKEESPQEQEKQQEEEDANRRLEEIRKKREKALK
ncbi:MAG: hypothetical protein JW863_09030 [Chitinispirillaceae bacterium]|nr:hypothetical protein [Chitinispirillaceae bacterium]